MNKIRKVFQQSQKTVLIGYLTLGDPEIQDIIKTSQVLEDSGVDILELGIPYSDPLADGPYLQMAAERALKAGMNTDKAFELTGKIREKTSMPLVFLVYYNTILNYGPEKFLEQCRKLEVSGIVCPDIPVEERGELLPLMKDIALIPLVAQTSGERIPKILEGTDGFVYCVSSPGVTGIRKDFDKNVSEFLKEVRSRTDMPLAVGFGISKREDVEFFEEFADGVIVGTALMKKVIEAKGNYNELGEYIKYLKGD